jgi:hypothetical protein
VTDHQFDIILPSVSKINQKTVAEARRNRADRIKRETGEIVDPKKIPNTDIVFRITCWEHIPMAPKKITKAQAKKRKLEDILDLEEVTEFFACDDVNAYELFEFIGTLFAFIEYDDVPLFEE